MKYKYTILEQSMSDELKAKMNELGAEGWRLISFVQIDHSLTCIVVFELEGGDEPEPLFGKRVKKAK